MRYLLKFSFNAEVGNVVTRDPEFGHKMESLLKEMQAEAAYFGPVNGHRGGYIVFSMDNASQIPAMLEPLFIWLKAEVELIPVMLPQDLANAGPAREAAIQKWG